MYSAFKNLNLLPNTITCIVLLVLFFLFDDSKQFPQHLIKILIFLLISECLVWMIVIYIFLKFYFHFDVIGRRIGHGESERDAVYVVPNGMCGSISEIRSLGRSFEKVS